MDLPAERVRLEAAVAAGDQPARIALAHVLQQLGEYVAAIDVLEAGTPATPRQSAEALVALAVSHQALAAPDAVATWRAAVARAVAAVGENDPLTARACWELGALTGDAALIERAARVWDVNAQPAWALRARAFAVRLRDRSTTAPDGLRGPGAPSRDPTGGAIARGLYAQALAALDLALGETSPQLVDILFEAADAFEDIPARAMRERAVRIARGATGPASRRTLAALWTFATATGDAGVFAAARAAAADDLAAAAELAYAHAAFVDGEAGLRVREEALELREQLLGPESHALVPLVNEIKLGWDELGRPDEAEAFLRRCRARVAPASLAYRNLTYSIGRALAEQQRGVEYAELWRDFLAARAATAAPDAPEMLEALEIVQKELRAATPDAIAGAFAPPIAGDRATPAVGTPVIAAPQPSPANDLAATPPLGTAAIPQGRSPFARTADYGDPSVERPRTVTPVPAPRSAFAHTALGPDATKAPAPADPPPYTSSGWFADAPDELDLTAGALAPLAARLGEAELRVVAAYFEGDYPEQATNAHAILAAIVERPRPALRSLALIQRAVDAAGTLPWLAGCPHAALPLATALPALASLELAGFDLVHALAHPALARLVLHERPICPDGAWDLPALHALTWSITADTDLATIDPVWTQPLPALRELAIAASFFDCEGLLDRDDVRARVATLTHLTLPVALLDDDPIATLLEHADRLAHLTLAVPGLDFGDPRLPRLRRALTLQAP